MSTIAEKRQARVKEKQPIVQNAEKATKSKVEFDTPWKKVLDLYLEDFIALCWPEQYSQVDWKKGYKMLDKELSKISRNAPITNRVVDKLAGLILKDGTSINIFLHIEIQGTKAKNFTDRMFTYRYRIRDLYGKSVASLAVLIDPDPKWRPQVHRETFWGTSIEMSFPIVKLVDFLDRIPELEASANKFAAVILAQLSVLENPSPNAKMNSKIRLIAWLYRKGWKKEDVLSLITFIDWLFILPEPLETQCRQAIELLEEELRVEYITSFERHGIEKGIQQGIDLGMQQGIDLGIQKGIDLGKKQGEGAILLRLLQHKFKGQLPDFYYTKIQEASADTLLLWAERVLDSDKLEEIFKV